MTTRHDARGFSLIEMMIAVTIFALAILVVFQMTQTAQRSMKSEATHDSVEGGASILLDRLGRDIREASSAYLYAGDWLATRSAGGVTIDVARNYFSATPLAGGNLLAPGITTEGWSQCPNPVCSWSTHQGPSGTELTLPQAFLAHPTRNNLVSVQPVVPPASFSFSSADARGRMQSRLDPGDACPHCGAALSDEAFFSGLMVLSPRRADNTFSYGGPTGYEAQWESIVFYCPYRDPSTGLSDLRRYVFYASSLGANASLLDLLDFDGNGLIETPPMTDSAGDFILDADSERFHLTTGAGAALDLLYEKVDAAAGRQFRIQIDRAAGTADVTVVGGPYATGGALNMRLKTRAYALGLSDFDVSTYINNPSWTSGALTVNETGVAEVGVVRVTFQMDRPGTPLAGPVETVHTTTLRPRN